MATREAVRATKAQAITTSDVTEYDPPLEGLYIGVSGNVAVVLEKDSAPVTLLSVPIGLLTGFRIKQVYATGTTATNIIGFK